MPHLVPTLRTALSLACRPVPLVRPARLGVRLLSAAPVPRASVVERVRELVIGRTGAWRHHAASKDDSAVSMLLRGHDARAEAAAKEQARISAGKRKGGKATGAPAGEVRGRRAKVVESGGEQAVDAAQASVTPGCIEATPPRLATLPGTVIRTGPTRTTPPVAPRAVPARKQRPNGHCFPTDAEMIDQQLLYRHERCKVRVQAHAAALRAPRDSHFPKHQHRLHRDARDCVEALTAGYQAGKRLPLSGSDGKGARSRDRTGVSAAEALRRYRSEEVVLETGVRMRVMAAEAEERRLRVRWQEAVDQWVRRDVAQKCMLPEGPVEH